MKLKEIVIQGTLSKVEVESIARSMFGKKVTKAHLRDVSMPYDIVLPDFDDLAEHVQKFVLKAFLEAEANIDMGDSISQNPDDVGTYRNSEELDEYSND